MSQAFPGGLEMKKCARSVLPFFLLMALTGCDIPGISTTKDVTLKIEFLGQPTVSAPDAEEDRTVDTLVVQAIDESDEIVGSGTISEKEGVWKGDISVSSNDFVYFIAAALNSQDEVIFFGTSAYAARLKDINRDVQIIMSCVWTVTYDSQNGQISEPIRVLEGSYLWPPEPPTKEGYSFSSWYMQSECLDVWDFNTDRVSSSMVLYAGWAKVIQMVTISFSVPHGTIITPQIIEKGEMIAPPSDPIHDEGLVFGGWFKEPECIEQWNFYSDVAQESLTLYAKWLSNDARISRVEASFGLLMPDWISSEAYSYTDWYWIGVPNQITSITLNGFPYDENASAEGQSGQVIVLDIGMNDITITIVAEDGIHAEDYSFMVFRNGVIPDGYTSPTVGTMKGIPNGMYQPMVSMGSIWNVFEISEFLMAENEVTRAQFSAVMGIDPSDTESSSGTSDPVQRISWYDAIAFCNKASIAEGLETVYFIPGIDFSTLTYADIPASMNDAWNAVSADWSANGYRLPTEGEWMWAAIGSFDHAEGHENPFAGFDGSNAAEFGAYAWCFENSNGKTHPVGTKLENQFGIHDLSGNVCEWVWDGYGGSGLGLLVDPVGPVSSFSRLAHGGSYNFSGIYPIRCHPTDIVNIFPHERSKEFGFRVVRRL